MAYDVVNAADLPQETSTTLDGTEQLIGFDTAQGKRVTVNDLAEYILQRKLSSLAGASQTVAAALAALNSKSDNFFKYKAAISQSDLDSMGEYSSITQGYISINSGNIITEGWGMVMTARAGDNASRTVQVVFMIAGNSMYIYARRANSASASTWNNFMVISSN